MATKTFINLPVKDLDKSIEFFGKLGFEFNPQFTDENAACMIIGAECFVMLLVGEYFKRFTKKEIVDARSSTETIIALSADSREAVDELVHKALEAGAGCFREPEDQGSMYGWGFQDLDGHLWEVFYMDESTIVRA